MSKSAVLKACIITLALGLTATLAHGGPVEDFKAGNEAFWQGKHRQAIATYGQVIDAGVRNADVYFNLGNAHAGAGDLGKAVWAFEQALLLRPEDADAQHNLKVVTDQVLERIGAEGSDQKRIVPGQSDTSTDLFMALSPSTLTIMAAVFWTTLFALLLAIRYAVGGRRTALMFSAVLVGLGALASGGLILGRELVVSQNTYAIVIADKALAKVGPESNYKTVAEVYAGVKVQVRGEEEGWVGIILPNGAGAWMRPTELRALKLD
ncbi:MAG: tetratricopeptide repeat protein [Bradymonadia bacterium]